MLKKKSQLFLVDHFLPRLTLQYALARNGTKTLVFGDMTLNVKILSNPHHHLDDIDVEEASTILWLV